MFALPIHARTTAEERAPTHLPAKTRRTNPDYTICLQPQPIAIAALGGMSCQAEPKPIHPDPDDASTTPQGIPAAIQSPAMPRKSPSKQPTQKPHLPVPTRPRMPAGYVPKGTKSQFLSWDWVTERLEKSHNYWICTTRHDGRPHAMPVWAVWHDGGVAFSTDPSSLKARNMQACPQVVIHLESGDEVVILEGQVMQIKLTSGIDDAYNRKYKMRLSTFPGGASIYQLKPKVVMAWREKDFVSSGTKWDFIERT